MKLELAFLLTLLILSLLHISVKKYRLSKQPDENWLEPKPRYGGFAFGASFLCLAGLFFEPPAGYLFSILLMWLLGIIDDFKTLSWKGKAGGQLLIFCVFFGMIVLPLLHSFSTLSILAIGICLVMFYIIQVNAVNLSDGIDGVAGGASLVGLIGHAVICSFFAPELLPILGLLSISLATFLIFNNPPAKCVMGDTGSLLLGLHFFAFPFLILALKLPLWVVLVSASFPLFFYIDALRVMLIRKLNNKSIVHADRNHLQHILLDNSKSLTLTKSLIYGYTGLYVFPLISLTLTFHHHPSIESKLPITLAVIVIAILIQVLSPSIFIQGYLKIKKEKPDINLRMVKPLVANTIAVILIGASIMCALLNPEIFVNLSIYLKLSLVELLICVGVLLLLKIPNTKVQLIKIYGLAASFFFLTDIFNHWFSPLTLITKLTAILSFIVVYLICLSVHFKNQNNIPSHLELLIGITLGYVGIFLFIFH